MKTRIQSILWALFLGLSFSLLMNSCQKDSFLDIKPAAATVPLDHQQVPSHANAAPEDTQPFAAPFQPEVVRAASATDVIQPLVLRVNCRIMTILYKPDEKVQVYKCIGQDLHTQVPVEIKGKRFKKYLTGEIENKGVILFPDGDIRLHQVGSTPDGNLNFTLAGVSGSMAGGVGSGTWIDPQGWLAGNTLFEGTLLK